MYRTNIVLWSKTLIFRKLKFGIEIVSRNIVHPPFQEPWDRENWLQSLGPQRRFLGPRVQSSSSVQPLRLKEPACHPQLHGNLDISLLKRLLVAQECNVLIIAGLNPESDNILSISMPTASSDCSLIIVCPTIILIMVQWTLVIC